MYSKKITQKKKQFPEKRQNQVGSWSTYTLSSFSQIFEFFLAWQNPTVIVITSTFIADSHNHDNQYIYVSN